MKKINIITLILLSFSFVLSNKEFNLLTNESYMTGVDGIIRMNINVIGHVKNPGNHLVYDGIDLLSLLSVAGGYLEGANLKNIKIYHKDGTNENIDLSNFFDLNVPLNNLVVLRPNDTIYVEQKKISQIMRSSNLPAILLSILNIALTLERTD